VDSRQKLRLAAALAGTGNRLTESGSGETLVGGKPGLKSERLCVALAVGRRAAVGPKANGPNPVWARVSGRKAGSTFPGRAGHSLFGPAGQKPPCLALYIGIALTGRLCRWAAVSRLCGITVTNPKRAGRLTCQGTGWRETAVRFPPQQGWINNLDSPGASCAADRSKSEAEF